MSLPRPLGALGTVALLLAATQALRAPATVGYRTGPTLSRADDTLRVRLAGSHPAASRPGRMGLDFRVAGYLSRRGLPPVQGSLTITDTGLVFRSADGRYTGTLPVVGPVRESPQGRWRASAVALAYADDALGPRTYLFRVDGGVFETERPGALMDVAAHPTWLDSLTSREWTRERGLVDAADPEAAGDLVDALMHGAYADSLFAVFGRPARPAGVVGQRGRAAGRLGEYVATRDSVALDPARMASVDQLRHTVAHELAHRWQARASSQLALLWKSVPPIRDPKRYGYRNLGEQQAEAAAFAIHFLLATAGASAAQPDAATLDHYELLVPGTRTMARYLAMQPVFGRHPLRALLTRGG